MAEGTLHDAFIDELRDAYDGEKQLTKALTKLAKAARSPELRDAFESHLEETQGQIERLEQVFESLDEKVRGKHCDGIAGIVEEGKAIMGEDRYQYMAVYELESEATFQRFLESGHLEELKREYDAHFGSVSERARSAYVQVWP